MPASVLLYKPAALLVLGCGFCRGGALPPAALLPLASSVGLNLYVMSICLPAALQQAARLWQRHHPRRQGDGLQGPGPPVQGVSAHKCQVVRMIPAAGAPGWASEHDPSCSGVQAVRHTSAAAVCACKPAPASCWEGISVCRLNNTCASAGAGRTLTAAPLYPAEIDGLMLCCCSYWEDIGTVRAFYESNLALTDSPNPNFRWAACRPQGGG